MNEADLLQARFEGKGLEMVSALLNGEGGRANEGPPVSMLEFRQGWCMVLALAVLDYWFQRPATQKFQTARDWIFYSGANAPNSFENVAMFLNFNPRSLQQAITARRSEFMLDPRRANLTMDLLRGLGSNMCVRAVPTDRESDNEQVG